jgi:hypothetical protein
MGAADALIVTSCGGDDTQRCDLFSFQDCPQEIHIVDDARSAAHRALKLPVWCVRFDEAGRAGCFIRKEAQWSDLRPLPVPGLRGLVCAEQASYQT